MLTSSDMAFHVPYRCIRYPMKKTVFLYSGPQVPLPCMFLTSPCSNTTYSNEQVRVLQRLDDKLTGLFMICLFICTDKK